MEKLIGFTPVQIYPVNPYPYSITYVYLTHLHPLPPPTQYYSTGIGTKIVILSPINGKVGKLFKKYAVDIEKHNKE